MKIGMKIRQKRMEKGYSQLYMAECLGMVQNNYSKIELGSVKLTIQRLEEIAKILEVDMFSLLQGEQVVYYNNSQSGDAVSNQMNVSNPYADRVIEMLDSEIAKLKEELAAQKLLVQQLQNKRK